MSAELPPKQQRFVEEYLKDLNGTQAAIRAGYSPKTANEQASQLLAKLSVQEAVQLAKQKRSEKAQIDAQQVFDDIQELYVMAKSSAQLMAALKAKELQAKHLGMFTEKVQHSSDPENPIIPVVEVIFKRPDDSD